MALVSTPVPNLIGGVSQQPASMRYPGQAEEQDNAMSTVVEGLSKRPPTEHIAKVSTDTSGDLLIHTINRDTTERYVVALGDQSVLGDNALRVYGIDGTAKTIRDNGGNPADSGDFAYLDCTNPTEDLKVLTVNDYTFIVNKTKTVELAADTTPDPGHQALVTIVLGNYATRYTVNVKYGPDNIEVTKETSTGDGGDIQTTQIASDIYTALTAGFATGCTISRSGSSTYLADSANGWDLSISGSTISIKRTTTTEDFIVNLEDSVGNGNATLVKDTAQTFTDLPLVAPNGFTTKIAGDPESGADDYYVKFVTTNGQSFEEGTWEETVAPGITYKLDPATMPHLLLRQADGDFRFTPADGHTYTLGSDDYTVPEWGEREAGDADTNPDPSFVGKTINDVFFFKNRLGLLSGENILMSEAAAFFSFFRTTVTQLLDSAVIDVTAAHTKVAVLRHAVPFVEVLVLFSDQTQFVLRSEGMLSPRTVSITPSSEFENSRNAEPVATGDAIFFATDRGAYAGVREYRDVSSQRLSFEALEVSAPVPTYITGEVTKMAASTKEDVLVVLATGSTQTLWVYKYFNNGGQRVQSSWFTFTLGPDAEIKNADFIDSTLYMLIQRAEGVFLEKLSFEPGQADTDSTFKICLDRRIKETDCDSRTYDSATDQTTLNLPYNLAAGRTMQVVSRQTSLSGTEAVDLNGETVTAVYYATPPASPWFTTGPSVEIRVYGGVLTDAPSSIYVGDEITLDIASWPGGGNFNASVSEPYTVSEVFFQAWSSTLVIRAEWPEGKAAPSPTFDTASGTVGDSIDFVVAAHRAGINHKVLSTGTDTLVIAGDQTSTPLWIGEQYTFKYVFSEPTLQVASQRGGMAPVLSGRFQVRRGTLLYEDSGYFKVTVTPDNQAAYEYLFTGQVIGAGILTIGAPSVTSGIFKFPVMARHDEVLIEVTNDTPLPTRLLSAEWEASYDRRSTRMG